MHQRIHPSKALKLIQAALILVVSVCSMQIISSNGQDDSFPYLTSDKVFVSEDPYGNDVVDSQSLKVTNYYYVQTSITNKSPDTKEFPAVYPVVMILDQNDVAQYVGFNNYGGQSWLANRSIVFQVPWFLPQLPGKYTVKTFLISGLENPLVLTRIATLNITVSERIEKLREGQSNERIRVQSINLTDTSVYVTESYCVGSSYHDEVEANLHVGEHVSIAAVDVYFMGIEDEKAVFELKANSDFESDGCII